MNQIEIEPILNGERLPLSRLLTQIENDTPESRAALEALYRYTGTSHIIGVTGHPGCGKSSLVNALVQLYRSPPEDQIPSRTAVVAVDPSSPFTGGALLGDRVRMRELSGDPGVFIRSSASRGAAGGLARTTNAMVQAFSAAGYSVVIVETVGAGQAEVEIAKLAHTTLVVESPGMGDDIQALKAGIMEIADILVVNKADRPGAENTARVLRNMLSLEPAVPEQESSRRNQGWQTPVVMTSTTEGTGITALREAVQRHNDYLTASGERVKRNRARAAALLDQAVQQAVREQWQLDHPAERVEQIYADVAAYEMSPGEAASQLLSRLLQKTRSSK